MKVDPYPLDSYKIGYLPKLSGDTHKAHAQPPSQNVDIEAGVCLNLMALK